VKQRLAIFASITLALVAVPAAVRGATDEPITPAVQSAIDRGLERLAATQGSTGAWQSANGVSPAITGLAIMSFLARGHVPGQGPYGDHLNRGVDALLGMQQESGLIASPRQIQTMYDHGIASIALCEVYGMLDDARQKRAHEAIAKAVRVIIDAQRVRKEPRHQGGWRYTPTTTESDLSVTGWQLMALRGAANCGAAVPRQAITDGMSYIKRRSVPGGGFSYVGNTNPNVARTATGVLCLELLGEHHSKESLEGGDFLMRNPVTDDRFGEFFYYGAYYAAQAANQLGGKYYDQILPPLRDALLQRQRSNGAWPAPGGLEQSGGEAYATSMAILALAVQYRYLPIYQR